MNDGCGRPNHDQYQNKGEARRDFPIRDRTESRSHPDANGRESDRHAESHRPLTHDGVKASPAKKPSASPAHSAQTDGKRKRVLSGSSAIAPPRAPPVPLSDVKKIADHIFQRVWWSTRKSTFDKKIQKLVSDIDRCNASHTDFGSAVDILKRDKNVAEDERNKHQSRVDAADEKLHSDLTQLIEDLWQFRADEDARPASHSSSGERPASGSDPPRSSVPQKLTEASVTRNLLAEETSAVKRSLRVEFQSKTKELEAQTVELREQLRRERERNDALEKKVEALTRKFDLPAKPGDQVHGQQPLQGGQATTTASGDKPGGLSDYDVALVRAKCMSDLERVAEEKRKDMVTKGELQKKLQDLDQAMSAAESSTGDGLHKTQSPTPGDKTANRLRSAMASVASLETKLQKVHSDSIGHLSLRVQELEDLMDGHGKEIQKHSGLHMDTDSAIKAIESSVAKLRVEQAPPADSGQRPGENQEGTAGACPAGVPGEQTPKPNHEEAGKMLTELVPGLVQKLKVYVNGEMDKRETLAKEAEQTTGQASELRSDLNKLRREHVALIEDCLAKLTQVSEQAAKGLTSSQRRMEALDLARQQAGIEAKMEIEELAMQVRSVQAWQNNFTTRQLYRDIVAHITTTLPNGLWQQLRSLSLRIDGIQARLDEGDGGSAKKRRFQAMDSAAGDGSPF